MLDSTAAGALLRQIPGELAAGVASGDYKIYGSIIRSVAQGRIVGHLQETTGIAKLVGLALAAPASMPLQGLGLGIDIVGHATSFVQNEQIKAAVATLQNLQLAGLALGAAGIGVSVVGFAVLSQKIRRVEAKVDAMGDKLDAIGRSVEALRRDHIAEDMVRLRTAAQRMDEGWQMSSPEAQWRDVAGEMHRLQNSFARRTGEMLAGEGAADLSGAEPFVEALALASAVRVSARLAAGDEVVARRAAEEGATLLHQHGRQFRLADAALARVRANGVEAAAPGWSEALEQATDAARPTIESMRMREAAAASTTLTLRELDERQIRGRAWLEEARREEDSPILFMAATA